MKPQNNTYRILGLMSGTSLDGVDLAICCFKKDNDWVFKIEKSQTIKYPNFWKKTLSELPSKSNGIIEKTDVEYGKYLGEIINSFMLYEKVNFIASHGHTIFHQPKNNYSLQIGCGETIANTTKITTINDFRSLDVSLGGQGAPLVPIGDLHLFPNYKYCINLGGFANISIKDGEEITAFDVCPVNIVLNDLSRRLGAEYDMNGEIAKSGELIPEFLDKLNNLDFYKQHPPKSLAREWVESQINPLISADYKIADILHTICEHIAIQIGQLLVSDKALFTGGGTFNNYLMERIGHHSSSNIIIPSNEIINYKEALIFAFLGLLRIRNEVNCLQRVTGATKDNCGGVIFKAV